MTRVVLDAGLEDRIVVDSSGTAGYHIGKHPDRRMIAAAARRGYDLQSHAKQFERSFFRERNLIIAMDRENFREIQRCQTGIAPHVKLFSEYLGDSWPNDVPDPYYGGDDGFEYVLDMLEAGCPKILEQIRIELGLPAQPA
ncbi:MAG: low molecular weight phosphotyrosine protein phosphatase [Pirellula sp.]|jgi:protein-tyrosine phosphatase|nr:low molecular weight phosphotyrosine protein phosphatase [Pirellula sp.]